MSKEQIRREIADKRETLDRPWLETASDRVVENFQTMDVFRSSATIALYMALGGEVNLDVLFPLCWKLGKRTCIPIFNSTSKIYEMAEVSEETEYRTGHYGIREPLSPILCSMDSIDLIAVPGVAFDRKGGRLGRGGGYYDRLLEGFGGDSVAVTFDFQILPQIPCEAHDKPVDSIVSEIEIINVLNEY